MTKLKVSPSLDERDLQITLAANRSSLYCKVMNDQPDFYVVEVVGPILRAHMEESFPTLELAIEFIDRILPGHEITLQAHWVGKNGVGEASVNLWMTKD